MEPRHSVDLLLIPSRCTLLRARRVRAACYRRSCGTRWCCSTRSASSVPPLGHSSDPVFALLQLVACWLLLSSVHHCSWFVADIWPPLRRSLNC